MPRRHFYLARIAVIVVMFFMVWTAVAIWSWITIAQLHRQIQALESQVVVPLKAQVTQLKVEKDACTMALKNQFFQNISLLQLVQHEDDDDDDDANNHRNNLNTGRRPKNNNVFDAHDFNNSYNSSLAPGQQINNSTQQQIKIEKNEEEFADEHNNATAAQQQQQQQLQARNNALSNQVSQLIANVQNLTRDNAVLMQINSDLVHVVDLLDASVSNLTAQCNGNNNNATSR
jgi:hypothetical protein